jgi:hypothetical protein
MKTAILVAVAIIILSSLPFVSRQTDATAQENEPAHAIGGQRNASAVTEARDRFESARGNDLATENRELRSADGHSVGKLDSKSFKGDSGVGAALQVNSSKRTKTLAVQPAQ